MVAGKQVKQQTTTPALHNSSGDGKKIHSQKRINACHIIPVISGLIMLSVESCSADSFTEFGEIFTG